MDLDWRHVRRAKEKGLKLCISPDAHSTGAIEYIQYGLGIARKGWLEADDLLDNMTAAQLIKWCRK